MILESLLMTLLEKLSISDSSYVESFIEVIKYICYFDNIVPVKLMIGCSLVILGYTLVACLVRLVIELL